MSKWEALDAGRTDFYCSACGAWSSFKKPSHILRLGPKQTYKIYLCEKCFKRMIRDLIKEHGNRPAKDFV